MVAATTQSTTAQNGGHHRVFGDEVASVLPKVLEPVAGQADHEQPR